LFIGFAAKSLFRRFLPEFATSRCRNFPDSLETLPPSLRGLKSASLLISPENRLIFADEFYGKNLMKSTIFAGKTLYPKASLKNSI